MMGEAKHKDIASIEGRAALKAAQAKAAKVRDKFGRGVHVGDGVLLAQTQPTEVVWRIVKETPATEPQFQGGIWLDVVATTRVLCPPLRPSDNMILVIPAEPAEKSAEDAGTPPAPARSPGGIILSDPDARD